MTTQAVETVTMTPVASTAIRNRRFVELTSAGLIQEVSGLTNDAIGVSQQASLATNDDIAIPVALLKGIVEVEAGAAVNRGANVGSDTEGRAIDPAAGGPIYGKAMKAASAAGEIIEVFMISGAARVDV